MTNKAAYIQITIPNRHAMTAAIPAIDNKTDILTYDKISQKDSAKKV